MSKPDSGLFEGTSGLNAIFGDAEQVIASRVKGLDLTPHPLKQPQLSAKKVKTIRSKIINRQATKDEYRRLQSQDRLQRRRERGIYNFWNEEFERVKSTGKGTRNWSKGQLEQLKMNRKPTFNGTVLEAHHSYDVKSFPHLANQAAVIYPATKREHFKGWHGGNYKNSIPGRRIIKINEF